VCATALVLRAAMTMSGNAGLQVTT
jgi:hypothetical protein